MFYLTSKFHDNRVNTFGFMEGGAFEAPPGPGTPKNPGGIGLISHDQLSAGLVAQMVKQR